MIASTILIAVPLAFLAGWVFSKALFRHVSVTRPNAVAPLSVDQPVVASVTIAAQKPQNSPASEPGLEQLRVKLHAAQIEKQSLLSDIQMLKEAAAEREQNIGELKRKMQVQAVLPEESRSAAAATEIVRQRKLLQAMQDKLKAAEQSATALRHDAEVAELKARRIAERFLHWRGKMKPLARQFRQQRMIIGELRDELRQRDVAQRARDEQRMNAALKKASQSAPSSAVPSVPAAASIIPQPIPPAVAQVEQAEAFAQDMAKFGDQEREDLQSLTGIGPALHKKLNAQGIFRLKQVALMSRQELKSLGKKLGVSPKSVFRHDWPRQARRQLSMAEPQAAELVS